MATSLPARAWVFALAFALHNAEELLLDLPLWVASRPQLGVLAALQGGGWFAPAALALSIGAVLLALIAARFPQRWMEFLLRIAAVLMLANSLSHLAFSILAESLMPGTLTALLVVAPVSLWLLLTPGKKKEPRQAGVR